MGIYQSLQFGVQVLLQRVNRLIYQTMNKWQSTLGAAGRVAGADAAWLRTFFVSSTAFTPSTLAKSAVDYFSLACPGKEYRGHMVKFPTPVYSFPCPEKDNRWHCHDFMLEAHLYQRGEDQGKVLMKRIVIDTSGNFSASS